MPGSPRKIYSRSGYLLGALALTSGLLGIASPRALLEGSLKSSKESVLTSLKNWGLINTLAKSHIHALDAWKISQGSHDIVIAVIDTGLDARHRSLEKNIWHEGASAGSALRTISTASAPSFVYGWNYVTNQPNPADEHGHGTHVGGIIGAVTDPSSGVSGVAHSVSLMSVKYYSDSNSGAVNLKNTVRAINYAVDHGARIINYSGGGPEFSEDEYLAIKRAEAKGVLFVSAAGNEHQDTDKVENYYYPSAYRLSNIISVAATDIQNRLLASSNWGRTKVDVAAPGENIYSTLPGGRFGYMSGTSQATAFVSGLAALLLAQDPSLKPTELKELIMKSVDKVGPLEGKIATGGRINAYSALLALKSRRGRPGDHPSLMAGSLPRSPGLANP